ncbi:MAG TPA: hypothetical protein G4O20_01225 [Dehalococcoidia bacterium]|nr:hypothetical protein [Dehalococcoidia bacterium]
MVLNRQIDERMLNMLKGNSASNGLRELKVQLALVQAACLMSIEETTRATASQITERAIREYGIEVSASFTGQVFAGMGIGTAMTHGKNRFILDRGRLEEMRKAITVRCEELAEKLESSIKYFQDLPERIKALEKEWKDIVKLRIKERELLNYVKEERNKPSQLPYLISEANKLKEQAAKVDKLQKECRNLSRKIRSIPSLEERKKSLEAAIATHEAKVRDISAKERGLVAREEELADRIVKIQKRMGWVELAILEQAIKEARDEIDTLSRQLGEKRSLLDKIFRRKEGNP